MAKKRVPFTKEKILEIKKKYPTPFIIYDEEAIIQNARRLKKAFEGLQFKEYFAVKACPNPHILKLLKQEGFGTDCSSLPELIMSEKVGITKENIMFTSNDTPEEEFIKAKELGAVINLDDISHIEFLEKYAGIPDLICFRYNPGRERKGNFIIGDPEDAKYGLTKEQLFNAYEIMKNKGVKRFGLHTMIISNELNHEYFIETARMLFNIAHELNQKLNIKLEFVNLGGGIGIPYKPEQEEVNLEEIGEGVRKAYDEMIVQKNLDPLKIYLECGRVITGPYGFLVTTVRHIKETYKKFAGTDATMANLMRPGMYGAYHHITVLGKEEAEKDMIYDVTGSMCENIDKFAIDRKLPKLERGDILAIHDSGAHGYSMGFNYNGKLRSAELLLQKDGSVRQIRRAETVDDYFATLDFSGL